MRQMIEVILEPVGKHVHIEAGSSVLQAARQAGVAVSAVCGGKGTCVSCRVQLVSGLVSSPASLEFAQISSSDLAEGIRLACQVRLLSDARVFFSPDSLSTLQRLQLEGSEVVYDIEPPLNGECPFGLAVDVGTTKLAAFLVDLRTGQTLAAQGAVNPQVAQGEDVISRIAFANEHPDGLAVLHHQLIHEINHLTRDLCQVGGVHREQIGQIVLVGNTAMHHFLTRLPVRSLGEAPYHAASTTPTHKAACELGLKLGPDASVYLPPNIAGFVGGDHLAMLLATCEKTRDGTILALDIGTNTEISLIRDSLHLTCSCASGPAFEGAHLVDGLRAIPGAIERVHIHEDEIEFQTIDNLPPLGVCGSGILDAVAELARVGVLNEKGAFTDKMAARINKRVILAGNKQSGIGKEIGVHHRDVQEIQLAKAAIRSGIEVLLHEAGISYSDIDHCILAGAFGTYLNLESAIRIKMFPPIPTERFIQAGNAAGVGAKIMLLSRKKQAWAEQKANQIRYIELTTYPGFTDIYMDSIGL